MKNGLKSGLGNLFDASGCIPSRPTFQKSPATGGQGQRQIWAEQRMQLLSLYSWLASAYPQDSPLYPPGMQNAL